MYSLCKCIECYMIPSKTGGRAQLGQIEAVENMQNCSSRFLLLFVAVLQRQTVYLAFRSTTSAFFV